MIRPAPVQVKNVARLMRDGPAVEQVAERDGGGEAEGGADDRGDPVVGRLRGGPEEQRGLEALAGDRDERGEGQGEGAHQRGRRRPCPAARSSMNRAVRRIQKIIQVTKQTATIDIRPPKRSCASKLRLREVKVSSAPNASDRAIAALTPTQIGRQPVAAPGLHQVGDQDADDEGGFEAFAQADQVVREHRPFRPSWSKASLT